MWFRRFALACTCWNSHHLGWPTPGFACAIAHLLAAVAPLPSRVLWLPAFACSWRHVRLLAPSSIASRLSSSRGCGGWPLSTVFYASVLCPREDVIIPLRHQLYAATVYMWLVQIGAHLKQPSRLCCEFQVDGWSLMKRLGLRASTLRRAACIARVFLAHIVFASNICRATKLILKFV